MPTLKNIDVSQVEKSLKELWDEETEKNKIKASLFNLIIYTHEERRTSYFREVVHSILEKYPSRIIFIEGNESDPQQFEVDVSNEPIGIGNVLITCDQITIKCGVEELHRVPSVILSLIIPDLPIYLLWGQDPTSENTILPRLEEFSRRLIFDSECTSNLQSFSQKMGTKLKEKNIELIDISWALISGWRDALSTVFHRKGKIAQLQKTQRLTISYYRKETDWIHHPETQAIYLQAWLASRLGWKFQKMTTENGQITLDYGDVSVTIFAEPKGSLASGEIASVEFASTDDQFVRLQSPPKDSKVLVHCSTLEHCDLPYTLLIPDMQRSFAFLKEIFYHYPSSHYGEMLTTLAKVDWRQLNQ